MNRRPSSSIVVLVFCGIVSLSGSAALLFETLWFRLAGLQLGNSVWASSIVLAAFMAGLALGNAFAARVGERLERPLRFYALAEILVGVFGLAVVLCLPRLTPAVVPLMRVAQELPGGVDILRGAIAFGVMLVPAAAMGVTLPVLARALSDSDPHFGRVLGRLYGWNTLGGMSGALAAELILIPRLGLTQTACFAAALNLSAGAAALALSRHSPARPSAPSRPTAPRTWLHFSGVPRRLLFAAAGAGAAVLALEVIWFRFLQLFVYGTAEAFAAMLAVVLAGIGVGGLLAAFWLRHRPDSADDSADDNVCALVALAAGVATEWTYVGFDRELWLPSGSLGLAHAELELSLRLMLPTTILSGLLFTLLGQALRRHCSGASETAGLLTLSNTLGAAAGAFVGGLFLLPRLGMEKSLFALVLVFGLVAALAWRRPVTRSARWLSLAGAALYVACVALFPFGTLMNVHLPTALAAHITPQSRLVAFRDSLTETISYLRVDWGGEPAYHQLVTNGHSMSGTGFYARRYMKLYVYWATALHPHPRKALLISYGVGNTAAALARSRSFESIDVVDISRDVLELSSLVGAQPEDPLSDPRVDVHIEDGRFFLHTTRERFDLITAEPPPPKGAGIVNLYSREYFQLVHDRLAPRGIATYWLPVQQLRTREAMAIVQAFCAAFDDCSAWTGAGADWMLAGTSEARRPTEQEFRRPWDDSSTGADLQEIGIEVPEQLGALFIADASGLRQWAAGVAMLDDDHPGRLSPYLPSALEVERTLQFADVSVTTTRFMASDFIARLWPDAIRRGSERYFEAQAIFDADYVGLGAGRKLEALDCILTSTALRTLPLLILDSEPRLQLIAARGYESGIDAPPRLLLHRGYGFLAQRTYGEAARAFGAARAADPFLADAGVLAAFSLWRDGRAPEARAVLATLEAEGLGSWRGEYDWLRDRLESTPDHGHFKKTGC